MDFFIMSKNCLIFFFWGGWCGGGPIKILEFFSFIEEFFETFKYIHTEATSLEYKHVVFRKP
jgi:hypothetical protein